MSRDTLHILVDKIADTDVRSAQQFLAYLASGPAVRASYLALLDDEPVTAEDVSSIEQAQLDIRAGRTVAHDEVLREFGID